MKINSRGFTLLELLIAVTIFSIAAIAIYSSFNVGIRAWRKAENSYEIRQEVRHALNTIAGGLRSAVDFTTNDFKDAFDGSSSEVSFWRTLKISDPEDEYSEGVFRITYTFDAEDGSLYYILQTYKESLEEMNEGRESGTKSLLISGASDFRLEYAYWDGEEIIWSGEWKEKGVTVPFGVKAYLTYSTQDEAQEVEFSETILIPRGRVEPIT